MSKRPRWSDDEVLIFGLSASAALLFVLAVLVMLNSASLPGAHH